MLKFMRPDTDQRTYNNMTHDIQLYRHKHNTVLTPTVEKHKPGILYTANFVYSNIVLVLFDVLFNLWIALRFCYFVGVLPLQRNRDVCVNEVCVCVCVCVCTCVFFT